MKKMAKIVAIVTLLCCVHLTYAQLSNYVFSSSVKSFVPLTGVTVLGNTTNDEEVFNQNTAPLYGPRKDVGFAIGFPFTFNNDVFDRFAVATNGYIVLGKDSFSINNLSVGVLGASNTAEGYSNIVAGFNMDIQAQSGSQLGYLTQGTAPNRTLTIEWKNYKVFASAGSSINFQIILHETTNDIEILYDAIKAGASSSNPVQVGLRGLSGNDFHTRLTATDWQATTQGLLNTDKCAVSNSLYPTVGLSYLFSIPTPCTAPPTPGVTVASNGGSTCPAVPFVLSVSGDGKGSGLSFQWQIQTLSGSWVDIANETGATLNSPAGISLTQTYRRKITCSGVSDYAQPVQVQVSTVSTVYASLPFSEGFENAWISSACGNKNLPNSSWKNSPATGDSSWRREDDGASANWTSGSSGAYTPSGSKSSAHSARFHSVKNQTPGLLDLFFDGSTGPSTKELSFDYINTSGNDSIGVYLSNDNGISFQQIQQNLGAVSTGWTSITWSLNTTSATAILRFQAVGDRGTTDIGLDNISLKAVNCVIPGNPKVFSVKANGASAIWVSTSAANGYQWEVRTGGTPGSGGAIVSGNTTDTLISISGLTPLVTYYFYVRSNCSSSEQSSWTNAQKFTTTPVNDICTDAINLIMGAAPTTGSCIAATQSNEPVACLGKSKWAYDVWYKFVAVSSRAIIKVVGANQFDAIVQAFDDNCVGGKSLGCVDATTQNGTETLTITNLNAGDTYYVRVYTYINSVTGTVPTGSSFTIAVTSPAIVPGIVTSCTSVNSVTIDSSNFNKWVALVDFSGRILAEINANGNVLGSVTGRVFINSGIRVSTNGSYYMERNLTIQPTNQPTTPILLKLYFLNTEYNNLKNQAGSGINSINDVVVSQTNDPCQKNQAANGILLMPSAASAYLTTGASVTVTTNQLAAYYFHGGSLPLSVHLVSFTAEKRDNQTLLQWKTNNKVNHKGFEVEYATDGVHFSTIGYVASKASGKQGKEVFQYSFVDERNTASPVNYYRLKMVSSNEAPQYSNIVVVRNHLTVESVYPNPATDQLTMVFHAPFSGMAQLSITDMAGKSVRSLSKEVRKGENTILLAVESLSKGNYLIHTQLGNGTSTVTKFQKQ